MFVDTIWRPWSNIAYEQRTIITGKYTKWNQILIFLSSVTTALDYKPYLLLTFSLLWFFVCLRSMTFWAVLFFFYLPGGVQRNSLGQRIAPIFYISGRTISGNFISYFIWLAVFSKCVKCRPSSSCSSQSINFRFLEFLRFEVLLAPPLEMKTIRFAYARTRNHYGKKCIKHQRFVWKPQPFSPQTHA